MKEVEKLKAVHADGRKTEFTPAAWKAMGNNKEGWKLAGKGGGSKAKKAENETLDLQKRAKLIEAAEGLQKDGDHMGAKARLMEAQAIKDDAGLKKLIAATDKGARVEYLAKAEEAKANEDFTGALENYGLAQQIKDTKGLQKLIKEIEDKLAPPSETEEDLL